MVVGLCLRLAVLLSLGEGQTVERVPSTAEMQAIHGVMDADGDSSVSMDEGLAYVRTHRLKMSVSSALPILQSMDTDKDGLLSHSEFKTDLKAWKNMDEDERESLEGIFLSFDEDADELLDQGEAARLTTWIFRGRKLDMNGDSKISIKEFNKLAEAKLQGASPQAKSESRSQGRSFFKKLDLDGDKQLSPKEYFSYESGIFAGQEALTKLFEIADVDGNKILTLDEIIQVRASQKFGGTSAFYHIREWIEKEGLTEKRDEL